MIDVCLLGCGGVMPIPTRYLTSLYLRYNGKAILVDCGEGTQVALREAAVKYSKIDVILITHLHADHISGIVGFLLTLGLEGRTEPLTVYGPSDTARTVTALLTLAPNLPFEIICKELTEEHEELHEIGIKINAFRLNHSVECLGYSFELKRIPKFNAEKAQALCIPVKYWSILQNGENIGGFTPSDVLGEERAGLKLLYATDTRPVDAITQHGKNADLLILEGMYGDADGREKAVENRHLTMQEAAEIARACEAKELWLTHYSPSVTDPEIYTSELKRIFPNTVMGKDGMDKALNFE